MDQRLTTLVTGASSGIGLHLAHEFAAAGHPVVLVAPNRDELERVADTLRRQHEVEVTSIAVDLEHPDCVERIASGLGARVVDVLVNNAGHGQLGNFWEIPLDRHLSVLRLNVESVVRLASHFLPGMIERDRGGLLNVASIAGFEPGPTLAVYHATKAFVLSWSEALATELADTSLHVTALCPGPTDTDFFLKADMENTRAFQQANLMAPQDVARIGYRAFMQGERVVVAGAMNRVMVASRRLMPETAQAAKNRKLYEEVEPGQRKRERGDREHAHDEQPHA